MDSASDEIRPENKTTIGDVEAFLRNQSFPKGPEEGHASKEIVDLNQEWERQAQNLARLFAKELEFKTPEEYIATLPKFEPQPEEYKGRLDIPVIVETRIPLKRMLELAGLVNYYVNVDIVTDWGEGGFATPSTTYTSWINNRTSDLGNSVNAVRKSLKVDERGANIYEGIALYLRDPKILDNPYLALPGSEVHPGSSPFLTGYTQDSRGEGQRPGLASYFNFDRYPDARFAVAGRKISIKS